MSIEEEILQMSYWENFKAAKDIARYLEIDNPKRIALEKCLVEILEKLEKYKEKTIILSDD